MVRQRLLAVPERPEPHWTAGAAALTVAAVLHRLRAVRGTAWLPVEAIRQERRRRRRLLGLVLADVVLLIAAGLGVDAATLVVAVVSLVGLPVGYLVLRRRRIRAVLDAAGGVVNVDDRLGDSPEIR